MIILYSTERLEILMHFYKGVTSKIDYSNPTTLDTIADFVRWCVLEPVEDGYEITKRGIGWVEKLLHVEVPNQYQ